MNPVTDSGTSPVYLDYYSLHRAPFTDDFDERFFYVSKALQQRLDLITHLTQFGDTVIVVSGPEGSGKTTLYNQFRDYAKDGWLLCPLPATKPDKLPELLAHRLDGRADSPLKQQLTDWVNSSVDESLLIILIDDAQQLDNETLQQLAVCFTQPVSDRIRLILFGTGETTGLIRQAQEKQLFRGSTQCIELPPFNEAETSAYLLHRMEMAGYDGENPFTETEIRAICKTAEGWPAATNHLADLCLNEHYSRHIAQQQSGSQLSMKPSNKKSWLTAAAFLLIAALLWIFMQPESEQAPDSTLAEQPLEMPALAMTKSEQAAEPAADNSSGVSTQITPSVAETLSTPETATESVNDQASDSNIVELIESYEALEEDNQQTKPDPDIKHVKQDLQLIAAKDNAQTVKNTDSVEVLAKNDQESEPATVAPPADTAVKSTATEVAQRENWLLQQPDSHFTLQLIGSRNEQAVQQFIKENNLPAEQTAYYRGQYKGAEWFVVLYGVYPSRSAAAEHIADLPKKIQQKKPWPRPMVSIHKAISANEPQT